jgi:pyruvate,water dikinase
MTYIIYPHETNRADQLGGKAGALAALAQTDLPIPAWMVLSSQAFEASLSQRQGEALAMVESAVERRDLLETVVLDPAVQTELEQALAALCPNGELVAVRSSALDEDGAGHSFAGQLDSFLFVPPQAVAEKVAVVWRSGFGERSLAYRREHGLSPIPPPPAVLIQRMVEAEVSGVAFSADPVSSRQDVAVVSAVFGFGTALVSGETDADTYHVDPAGAIIWRGIADKRLAHCISTNGTTGLQPVTIPPDQAGRPALDDAQVRAVADLARRVEAFFDRPQDIEWAIAADRLYLLQARPITTLTHRPEPQGKLNLWDNSNIAESYPGLTTPLTFSFARRAYEEVYRQFCRMMGVPPTIIAEHHTIFRRMLGFIRGRIYYNLLSWYRVLALLPGYRVNRSFMEQMMGVKEKLPEGLLDDVSAAGRGERWRDGLRLLRTIGGFIANYVLLPRHIDQFHQRLDDALGTHRPDLEPLRPDELAAYYRDLEGQLLTRWDAPLINDFFAMIFYGILRKLTEAWCGDANGTLQNNLLAGVGGLISAEPVARLRELAHLAAGDPELVETLCERPLPKIQEQMTRQPAFRAQVQTYLDKFGDRCLEELKLESVTLHDDPLLLYRSIGQLARARTPSTGPASNRTGKTGNDVAQAAGDLRRRSETQVSAALAGRLLRRVVFNWVLKNTRRRVRDRENLRFERTRVFARVRLIFTTLARKFHALGLLQEPNDIFYLEVEEVLGFIDGTATTTDLKGLAALRRQEFESYRAGSPPPDRLETRGMVHHGNVFYDAARMETTGGDQRQGIGCCPGVVRGRVRVVIDPARATLQPGDILVAERTDPGWILLFPAAAGLLVEHGSLLSHSAIVARELGLPAIVSLKGVTCWLKDGDEIEFDGSTGLVIKVM